MNLAWCHNRLAIGGFEGTVISKDIFEANRITHVINCRRDPHFNRALEVLAGVTILRNPTEDDGKEKAAEWFGRSIDFALGALASPRHRVLVLCCLGNNRSPSTALAILMAQGLPFDEATVLVRKALPDAQVRYAIDARIAVEALGYA